MQTVLLLTGLLPVVLAGPLLLGFLPQIAGWSRRRAVQLAILAVPVLGLGLALGGVVYCTVGPGGRDASRWDTAVAFALAAGLALTAVGGLALGLLRLALLARVTGHRAVAAPVLEDMARDIATGAGTRTPRVLLCAHPGPLALTYGLRRPTVLLSHWMVDHLDRRELEAVLAHELAHVARRDLLVVWVATILRDAFWYLPASRAAHRQLQCDKEYACDEFARRVTRRPLALAGALAKVWLHLAEQPRAGMAQALLGGTAPLEDRVARLLGNSQAGAPPTPQAPPTMAFGAGGAALLGLAAFQAVNLVVLLVPGSCDPAALLGRLC